MTPFLGQIQPFGFNFAPRGWALCDGQLLPISSNQALFSLLGCTYGGDCRTTFALPDLRSRSMVHVGTGPGMNPIQWGQRFGTADTTLQVANMPSHNHNGDFHATTSDATSDEPGSAFTLGTGQVIFSSSSNNTTLRSDTVSINNNGGSIPFNNYGPSLGIYVGIALQGIFPSRN